MYHLRRIKTMLLMLLVCTVAMAQPESGKIYRFVNYANPGHSLAAVSTTRSSVTTTVDHYSQYWLLETHPSNASAWTLRNLGNGLYLQHAGTSTPWGFVNTASSATALYYVTKDGYCTFNSANTTESWACMHYGAGPGCIVGWEYAGDATKWTMTEVSSVTSDELAANWEALAEFNNACDDNAVKDYTSALDALFADAACTTLESTYASMSVSAIQEDANYKALPAALQELVLKVRNGVWTEANYVDSKADWESDQAKKFRVQLYEPHSIAGDITSWLGINAHNNMDNPTGIFASYRDVVYVMVEGTIKEGASLYLYGLRGHGQMGSYNDGNAVQLHEGLNAVPYISDGNALWINYVVDTYNANGETDAERFPHKLSEYEPLKINIVGGYINGYYNAVGDDLWGAPDDDDDWDYYKDRASLESFTLLSHRVTMQFYMYTTNGSPGLYDLLDNIEVPKKPYCFSGTMGTPATFSQYEGMGLDYSTGKINIMLEAWNRIAYSEFATLGVLNAATIDKMNEKYPRWYNNWTERGKIYDYTTGNDGQSYQEYCGGVDYSEYFNHHCLAISNTSGYMSGGWQSSNYNINTAESIIDKIANEAGPTWGPAHEIGHQHQSLFTLNGLTEVTNNLHSNVAVWYMGMGTSRVNGTSGSLASVLEAFNTEGSDYYTNNIWALTQMYYRLWLYYHLAGNNTQFYPRLMENLRREPLEKGYYVGPGGLLRFYKHCCVAAGEDLTEFFRAHGMLSVMTDRLVGDYSNSVYNQSQEQIDAAIAEVKALGLPENIAPLFISDATPDATYGHDGTTQRSYWDGNSTTSGNNAEVGSYIDFVNGETVGTAPTLTIESTTVTIDGLDGVGIAIFNEKGEIVGFSTKSTFELSEECAALLASGEAVVKAVNADNSMVAIEVTDPTQIQYDLLGSLLEEANSMLALSDGTNTKPGFYKLSALDALKDAYSVAKNVYDEREVNSYSAAYEILKLACDELGNNADAIIAIKAGYTYWLENRQTAGKYIAVNDSKALIGSSYSEDDTKQQWVFEAAGEEDIYYIKNVSTQTYLGDLANEQQISATADKEGAIGYRAISLGNGLWALQCQNTAAKALNYYTWNGNNQIIGWDYEGEKPGSHWYLTAVGLDDNVENLYALQDLIEDTEALIDEMSVVQYKGDIDLASCNVTSNATEPGHGLELLYDGNTDTYFHTVWKDSEVDEEHYIQVDLGEGISITEFVWTYTTYTTQWGKDFPTCVEITGSNDALLWTDIKTLSDLPTDQKAEYTSELLGSSEVAYRYLRFTVTGTTSGGKFNEQYYFGLAEMGLNRSSTSVSRYAEFSSYITSDEIVAAYEALLDARNVLTTGENYAAAIENLQEQYDKLLDAYNKAKNATLTAKKNELQTLINNTTSLISSCGTVTYTPATYSGDVALQTDDAGANFYLITNSQQSNELSVGNLLDNATDTYYHSSWSTAADDDHYLQVNLGEGKGLAEFTFTYTTREHNAYPSPAPTNIQVYGSNDGESFEALLATFTSSDEDNALPAYNEWATEWTSTSIKGAESYDYLRFYVREAQGPGTNEVEGNGHHYFAMSEFSLTAIGTPESYTVELGNDAGGATNALMLAAYKENASAQATHTLATTLSQVEEAIAKLQADYDALKSAKESAVYVTYYVQVVGGDANGGVVYGGNSYLSSASFEAPINLTVADLTAIPLDGYAEPVVTLNGTTITVTYNKIYTVQVTGGGGNGGVTYNEQNYVDGATFDAQQSSFTKEDLTAIVPAGYTLKEVTVNHETGVISVSYTAIPLVDTAKYYTLACKATDHSTFIRDNGSVFNGRSAEGSLFQFEAADEDNGYYIKSYVSDKYLNCTANENTEDDAVVESEEKSTVWKMAKHTEGVVTLTAGHDKYLNNNGYAPTYLLARYHNGGPTSYNACSLWTLTEGTPLDKSALNTLIGETNTLIESCYTDEEFNFTGSLNVTEELMTATREAVAAAQEKYDSKATTESEYEAALTALQTAKNNLQAAIAYATLPVKLTYDANSPVTYKIAIARSDLSVLAYDESSAMVAVSDFKLGNKAHGWYFMAATDGKVLIMPYYNKNTTLALSTNSFSEGNSKVKGMAVGSDGYTQGWTITNANLNDDNRENGWYNITCTSNGTDTWYFSNHGGVNNKMGFYNDADDAGTRFKFEETDFSRSEAYYALYNYYHSEAKVEGGKIEGQDAVGYYPADKATAYNSAYGNATSILENAEATDDDYTEAYQALLAANEALVINMPEESKFYRLVSVARGSAQSPEYAYVNANDNKIYHSYSGNVDANYIWSFTETGNGTYKLTNLHTGTSLADNGWTLYQPLPLYGEAEDVAIVSLSSDGQVGIWCGDIMLHADGHGKVVRWIDDADSGSAWRIVEVEDMSLVNFTLKIGQYRHAGLYLNYAAEIPEGVEVYIAHTPDGEAGSIFADKLEGTVLPARTAVIVKGDEGVYTFKYTTGENTADIDKVDANLLGGSAYLKYQQVASEGNLCCVFGQKDGEVGLYKNWVGYADVNGTAAEDTNGDGKVNEDGGTHFKVSANKIYYEYEPSAVAGASAFRFRFNSNDEETTTIDNLQLTEDAVIYNLYGQRIVKIAEPGIYIVNGKKIYVSDKMILNND